MFQKKTVWQNLHVVGREVELPSPMMHFRPERRNQS